VSWISGPCNDPEPVDDEQEERDEKQPRNPEPVRWDIVMADSGTHWRTLRRGGNWPERKSSAGD
jgi:hypothetical protein